MEDAEESVPKRAWSRLSERLVAEGLQAAKPVVIPLWARCSVAGVAVAAALVLGVFLFMHGDEVAIEDVLIAEAVEQEADESGVIDGIKPSSEEVRGAESVDGEKVGESIEDSESEFGIVDSGDALASNEVSGSDAGEGSISVSNFEVGEGDSDGNLAEQIADSPKYIAEAVEVANVTDATETFDSWTDPFAEKGSNRSPNKIRTALTVSGDAFGNASTGSSSSSTGIRRQMTNGIEDELTPGIRESSDSNYGIPATFGVGVKILFTPRWSLGVGVNYSLLSRTFSGVYTSYNAAGELSSANYSNIRHRVDYIGIPVNAYFSIIQSHAVDFYVYAGGTIEKAVSSRYILDHDIPSYKESVKGVQCSADIGIGVEFIVVDWLGIYIDPSLRYYFPNSHQPKSIRTQEALNFGFEIGLRFRL